jgi:hypothetical protein
VGLSGNTTAIVVMATIALVVAAVWVLSIPPWNHRDLQRLHRVLGDFGLDLHSLPANYSGSVTAWGAGDGEAREEQFYVNGLRHGIWRTYASDGTLQNKCEYRFGKPWNGTCLIYKYKGFVAEFKNGVRISN